MAPSVDSGLLDSVAGGMDRHKSEKRHKKDKSERKRARDGDDDGDATRKHKKHRDRNNDAVNDATDEAGDTSPNAQLATESQEVQRKEKRHKKSKKSRRDDERAHIEKPRNPADSAPGMTEDSTALRTAGSTTVVGEETPAMSTEHSKKKSRKHKHGHQDRIEEERIPSELKPGTLGDSENSIAPKKKSKKKRSEHNPEDLEIEGTETANVLFSSVKAEKRKHKNKSLAVRYAEVDAMDIDVTPKAYLQPVNAPADPTFPFFTQKVYLYLPLYPAGFATPISSIAKQHLEPLVNHYSPMLRGVVLGYSNVSLSHRPSARRDPQTDDTPAVLESIDEYAVGFGWLTVDVSLFVPTRGAWMEGRVNLQNEGHIGVLCWEKFSASIDAKRLPPGWKWIDTLDTDFEGGHGVSEPVEGADGDVQGDPFADENQSLHQMHTTGYWVDASGKPARGSLLFRIRDFEIGRVGDHGYLSIVGTMLTEEEERDLETQEREEQRRRRKQLNPAGFLRAQTRRVPEFSITTFGKEDQEETAEQRLVFSKSRLNTPDD